MSALVGNAQKKLGLLREILVEKGLDGFVVGSGDAHSSEYVPEFAMRRTFISDFTGSAGTVLVTRDKALCWTDGRYFLQAGQELDS
jgi:Xaa-Pro aminopeptidase